MAGIFQGDIIIKTAIELGIEDMRKNPWLIEHMLDDLKRSAFLKDKYGQKQIDACKEWLANNQIDVYMRPRDDKDRLPNITIEMGPSNEKPEMKHMADLSVNKKILLPNKIDQPIPFVIPPFTPTGYDEATGLLSTDPSLDLSGVSPGMVLVDLASGNGYVILGVSSNGLMIEPNQNVSATQLAIVPQFQYYEARVEHAFFEETYNIGCNVHGDVQSLLFLWSIVAYSILRYKQSLLEANGFTETVLSSGNPDLNYNFTTDGGEKAYTRSLTIHGQVENSWIKAPHRFVEVVSLKEKVPTGFIGGIKIISNLDSPGFIDPAQQNWITVADSEDGDSDDGDE